jgi:hypothetical protein
MPTSMEEAWPKEDRPRYRYFVALLLQADRSADAAQTSRMVFALTQGMRGIARRLLS